MHTFECLTLSLTLPIDPQI